MILSTEFLDPLVEHCAGAGGLCMIWHGIDRKGYLVARIHVMSRKAEVTANSSDEMGGGGKRRGKEAKRDLIPYYTYIYPM